MEAASRAAGVIFLNDPWHLNIAFRAHAGVTSLLYLRKSAYMILLFRAVTLEELNSIESVRAFTNPDGLEVKYFADTESGARSYAGKAESAFNEGSYTIVRTSVDESLITQGMRAIVDGGINTVTIPTEMLGCLGPPVILP